MNTSITSKTSSILLNILNWIAEKDAIYRQATKLRNTPDERLADMGLTRQQANRAFFARYGHESADRQPMILRAGF